MEHVQLGKEEMEYRISAVVPVYNRERTISRCIDSIIAQTYPVHEIIVVDDGSEDRTLNIIKEEYCDCVRLIEQKHKGAQAARNVGIKAACGEYIAFLDSDDEWLPDKLELQTRQLQKNCDAVICSNGYIQRDCETSVQNVHHKETSGNQRVRAGSRKLLNMDGKNGLVYKWVLKESFYMFQGLLTAKRNLIAIGYLDEAVPSFQEWDAAIRLAEKFEFIYIKKPLFVYHLHDGETISKDLEKNIDGYEYICEKFKYDILQQLGKKELVQRYRELMKMSWKNKDRRVLKYFIKYISGKVNIFIFEGN